MNILEHITSIDVNGQFVVNATISELESMTKQKLDILQKYKQFLKNIQIFTERQKRLKEEMASNKSKK